MVFCILCSLPWKYETRDSNGTVSQYLVSLCRPLNVSSVDCGLSSSVCMISNGRAKSIGDTVEEFSDSIMTENHMREFILQLEGSECIGGGEKHRTFIIFKCGKTLVCNTSKLYVCLVFVCIII